MPRTIYLDNAATTRVATEVAELMARLMTEDFGNPASLHHMGVAAERWVGRARAQLGTALGDAFERQGRLVFTSGGTESDAIGVLGAARARKARGANRVVLSALEHRAVRESAQMLADEGFDVVTVPADARGLCDVQAMADAVDDKTAVCALLLVQNELGTVLPVAEVARAARARCKDVHVHCDAVQALGKIKIDVATLGVDSLAVSAHKIHGPKGVGALWLKTGARVRALWGGGGQEQGLRSGTSNVPGIAAFGLAAERAESVRDETERACHGFSEVLRTAAKKVASDVRENGAGAARVPHILNLAFRGVPAEPLLHVLESRGVLCSAGSACSERDKKPNAILQAIGLPKEYGAIRLSFGRETTMNEVEEAAHVIADAVRSLR